MFQFNKKLKRLDIPAENVLRLHRSLSDVQIALPGITAQKAKAYVCAFNTEHGLRVAIAFHLRDTNDVVFYLNGDGNILRKEIGTVLQEGVRFAETLGFILVDLDIHQLSPDARKTLWESLPLKNLPNKISPEKAATDKTPETDQGGNGGQLAQKVVKVEEVVEIDLGLPRASTLASMRRNKIPPTAEELEEKRIRLRERLGRFLSSM